MLLPLLLPVLARVAARGCPRLRTRCRMWGTWAQPAQGQGQGARCRAEAQPIARHTVIITEHRYHGRSPGTGPLYTVFVNHQPSTINHGACARRTSDACSTHVRSDLPQAVRLHILYVDELGNAMIGQREAMTWCVHSSLNVQPSLWNFSGLYCGVEGERREGLGPRGRKR